MLSGKEGYLLSISIIIPMYNAEKYIERCIKSIQRQQYHDYEVILVDDGSNDHSYEICQRLIKEDKRFRLIKQPNQGVSVARNTGMNLAKGEWFYFLDSDDELTSDALETMGKLIQNRYDWIVMGVRTVDTSTNEKGATAWFFEGDSYIGDKNDFPELLNHKLFMYPCGKLYRKNIIKEKNIQFPIGVQYGEDIRFNLEYFQYVSQYLLYKTYPFIYYIRQGAGLGSRYYENYFQVQIDLAEKVKHMAKDIYQIDSISNDRLQQYYYKQGINTAAAYLNVWKDQPLRKRLKEIKKIMNHPFFQQHVETEYSYSRINIIDYFLLKTKNYLMYHWIHYIYTQLKKMKKRKAGIVTITTGENYGNRLQNYAVQELLKDMGFKAETIHKTKFVFDAEKFPYMFKLHIKKILHYHLTKQEARRISFYKFRKKYMVRSKFIIDDQVPKKMEQYYDFFVAGSDQVWNPYLEYTTEENFLTFTTSEKKIALSASIAAENIPENKKKEWKKWIQDFRLLSVREEASVSLIEKLCEKKPVLLADPTIYLTAKRWRSIQKRVRIKPDTYILLYFLGEYKEEYRNTVQEIAKEHNLSVFELQSYENYEIAPDEFLYLIDHAALVCTDSFHGTVFSIIFHKNFLVFSRQENFINMESRIHTLLKVFHLEERMWTKTGKDAIFNTDFSNTDQIIQIEREKIVDFVSRI